MTVTLTLTATVISDDIQPLPLSAYGYRGVYPMAPRDLKYIIYPGAPKDKYGNSFVIPVGLGSKKAEPIDLDAKPAPIDVDAWEPSSREDPCEFQSKKLNSS